MVAKFNLNMIFKLHKRQSTVQQFEIDSSIKLLVINYMAPHKREETNKPN